MSFDVWLENRTPFDAATHVQLNAEGQEILLVILSASFEPGGNGLTPANDQQPVFFADEPLGDPALSSNRYEADIALEKPGVEVLVIGQAYAPGGRPAREVDVGFQVGTLRKVLRVTGDRLETTGGVSAPQPFRFMPLTWERAYGGTTDEGDVDLRNPVGIGWKGARSADPAITSTLPNIKYVQDDDGATRPAGFGTIGRGWHPRLSLAGTYDDDWIANQWPLTPHDFDMRYNLCAPADQRLETLPDHAQITTLNMTPEGRWSFRLPALRVPVQMVYADRIETVDFTPDTIILEPDLKRVTVKARHMLQCRRNAPRLQEVVLGHVSPVWANARRTGKTYINPLGGDGTLHDVPVWVP